MDLIFQTRGLKLINRLFSPNKQAETAIPFYPQKPDFPGVKPISQPFERVTPEEVGVDSARVNEFINELISDKSLPMSTRKNLADMAQTVSSLAKQMINNADVVLRTEKLIAEGKLKDSAIEKLVR